ncbi:MAG: DUF5677 domain-containing protein [Candidatus Humimicrobiaceae bacterium]
MSSSKLSDHIFKKGKFITPWNNALGSVSKMQSWSQNRLPEYLWLGLVLDKYRRKGGLEKLCFILKQFHEINKELSAPAFSLILKLSDEEQKKLYSCIVKIADKEVLTPLTLLYTYSDYPEFSRCFCNPQMSLVKRQQIVSDVMKKGYSHQSEFATDIRFLVLYFSLLNGKLHMPKEQLDLILEYPHLEHSDEKMRIIRPTIRSMEMVLLNLETLDEQFLENFWRRISKMSECNLFYINFPNNTEDANKYMELLHEVFQYLSGCFTAITPLDKKMLVLLGIATYSYKKLMEITEHDLYNTIAARSAVRTVIENFIMMKYLIKNENDQDNIWDKYQYYGIGLYKVVLARSRETENDLSDSHIDYKYLELLVNEYMDEEYLDMDTSYFDKQNIREKAIAIGENELYGLYYDYDSSYEHGLWGAIRESSLLKCESPAHQFHCVPDYENKQNLKNVWPDCVMVMNKIIALLNELYSIPEHLLKEVMNFGK